MKMKSSYEVLSSVIKTAQMGQIGIRSLLNMPLDSKLQSALRSQLKEYDCIEREAFEISRSKGWDPKEQKSSVQIMTNMMTRMRLCYGDASSKAAAMMVTGNTRGVIKGLKNLHHYEGHDEKITAIAKKLLDCEEKISGKCRDLSNLCTFFFARHRIVTVVKGGVYLPGTGYLQVRAYTSNAQIPLKDVAISVSDANNSAVAMRLTNKDGTFDVPLEIATADISAGQQPNTGVFPYVLVNLAARIEDYEEIDVRNIQIFPDTQTTQELEFIPLAEFPKAWNKVEIFDTQTQNL